ncbi:hypothetical protein [Bifidobacterium dentium]|uniref:hypothetical protein n=1 Tax=Bifidobacterium dentium TaxID=1689 RepID=UPI00321A74E3
MKDILRSIERNNVGGDALQLFVSGLMNSQPDRHGNSGSETVSREKAQATVYSAAFLVQCFKTGLVHRKMNWTNAEL